jgi:acyl carrier protein
MLEKIRACMKAALKLNDREAAAINLESTPVTVRGWTSQSHLELILGLERALGVMFEANEIAELASVAAIVKALEQRRVG